MHQHRLELSVESDPRAERWERVRYFGFAAIAGVLLLLNLTGYFRTVWGIDTAAILTIVTGYRTFYNAIHGLLERKISADLAICIAVIAALSVGEYLAAAEAMFIMLVGEGLEGYAAKRTSRAIRRFVEQMPRRARLLRDGEEIEVDAALLHENDLIVVRAGERIPADGAVAQGHSAVDESTITGEPLPRDKAPGEEVFSGTLNGNGLLQIRVTRAGNDTTLARVIKLVEQAREKRAPVERLADRYAQYFVPALLLAGAGTFYFTRDWMRTVAVLIVGCPCALILATPTAMVAAIGGLARRGILVRGGAVLQQAAGIDTIVFDKTGTITEGNFEIVGIHALSAASEDEVLALAAAAEAGSEHTLARVIAEEARRRGLCLAVVESARELPGRGAEAMLNGRALRAGNAAFLAEHGLAAPAAILEQADKLGATLVLVAAGEQVAGAIYLRDRIRAGAREAIHSLEHLDISRRIMLTGDRRRAAEAIAREVEIPSVEAELLPEQKLDRIRALIATGAKVAMVGDGVNDAPALAAAHVGIAVSGASDITAEAADVVYLGRSLEKLPELFEVSRRAVSTAWQNIIVFAGIVNVVAISLGATGVLGPLGAAFTHQIASFLVMLNSLRLLRMPGRETEPAPRWWHRTIWKAKLWISRLEPVEWLYYLHDQRRRYYRPTLLTLGAAAVLNGFYSIAPDEVGVSERFGRRILPNREPGLHYKFPWPVESLTRVQSRRIRVVEIGFRSTATQAEGAEPAAYEWNAQHRAGRFQRRLDESLMLTGDQNMTELTATVHFRLKQPDDYLFRLADGEAAVRAATEAALQAVLSSTPLDDALTTNRFALEDRARRLLDASLERYRAGVEVLQVKLLDVHPSLEVVDAFRAVSGAYEEKNRLVNEAQAYANDIVPKARGEAKARLETAQGYRLGRVNRASGDAARFEQSEAAFRSGPAVTETRLYLETMEQVLPGRRKLIVDANSGRRHLYLLEDGVQFLPPQK